MFNVSRPTTQQTPEEEKTAITKDPVNVSDESESNKQAVSTISSKNVTEEPVKTTASSNDENGVAKTAEPENNSETASSEPAASQTAPSLDNKGSDEERAAPKPTVSKVRIRANESITSEEEALAETQQRVLILFHLCNNQENRMEYFFGTMPALQIFMKMYSAIYEWKSWKVAVVDKLCKLGFMEFLAEALIYLCGQTPTTNPKLQIQFAQRIVLGHISGYTDASLAAGKLLANAGVIPYLVGLINNDELKNNLSEEKNNALASVCLCSIHNIAKLSEFKSHFEEASAVDALKFFFTAPLEKMQISALCGVACLLGDSEAANGLLDECSIIPKLVNVLHAALKNEEHSSEGFSAEELVESLAFLAVNDNNKAQIVNSGAIDALREMLAPTASTLEQQRSADCLWTLAFNEEIRKKICDTNDVIMLLEGIVKTTDNESLKVKAQRTKDFLKFGKEGLNKMAERRTTGKEGEGHIFISYCWIQQQVILQIRQLLLDSGFKVWIDLDRMHGSTLEAMALAVEQASVVLICYSENYRLSNMCRTEAEYVFKLGKPFIPVNLQYRYQPSGWLGIIIGAKLYIDLSLEKHAFNKVAPKLLSEIEQVTSISEKTEGDGQQAHDAVLQKVVMRKGGVISHETHQSTVNGAKGACECCKLMEALFSDVFKVGNATGNQVMPSSLGVLPPSEEKQNAVRSWSPENVKNWLKSEHLDHLVNAFGQFDGQALLGLYQMKFSAVKHYYKSLTQLVGDSFVDSVKLTAALDKLLT